jgi:hypothetical protein
MVKDSETFLSYVETGLERFGGLKRFRCCLSAQQKQIWFDPEISPKLADFRRHVMPCFGPIKLTFSICFTVVSSRDPTKIWQADHSALDIRPMPSRLLSLVLDRFEAVEEMVALRRSGGVLVF